MRMKFLKLEEKIYLIMNGWFMHNSDWKTGNTNIKFPIKSKNGQYFKIYQDNINLHIQFGPTQNIEMPFYLKYSRNDISFSEMSYSECKILK